MTPGARWVLLAASLLVAAPLAGAPLSVAPEPLGSPPESGSPPTTADTSPASPAEGLAGSPVAPAVRLAPAAVAETGLLRRLAAAPPSGTPPVVGIVRPLPVPLTLRFGPENRLKLTELRGGHAFAGGRLFADPSAGIFWRVAVSVEDAWRLRLRLRVDDRAAGAGVRIWVRGAADDWDGPWAGDRRGPDAVFWLPSVAGPTVELLVGFEGAMPDAEVVVDAVGELFPVDVSGWPLALTAETQAGDCRLDAPCPEAQAWPWAEAAAASVALVNFERDGLMVTCSAGLIADAEPETDIPYLLTANHCISTPESAASVEAWWDYRSAECGGPPPDPDSVPRSLGAQLLATGSRGDFTLLRLQEVPPGRWQMGWSRHPSAASAGTELHRISHPSGEPQSYSRSRVGDAPYSCSTWPESSSIYQRGTLGRVEGGSSGSPTMTTEGFIVGQLAGLCGLFSSPPCEFGNSVVDGALSSYWTEVAPWLGGGCDYTILAPSAGEAWPRGEAQELRWRTEGPACADTVKLRLWRGGELVGVIARDAPNDGVFTWTVPAGRAPGDDYAVQVVDGDDDRFEAVSAAFSITTAAPACAYVLERPNGGEAWPRGEAQDLRWRTEGPACADTVKLRLWRGGELVGVIARNAPNDGVFTWTVPAGRAPGDDYAVQVVDGAIAGLGDDSDGPFSIVTATAD